MDSDTVAYYNNMAEYWTMFYKDWDIQLEREGLSLRSIFRKKGVERVLVAASGIGTQAIPLAKLGYAVVATSASPVMLQKAQELATNEGVAEQIQFINASFDDLLEETTGEFDAIVCKGNALPHLITDEAIETTLLIFHELLRPGGVLVVGLQDFEPFTQNRPRFLPGVDHVNDDGSEFITFDIWEWQDGPPTIATRNLYMVRGTPPQMATTKHSVMFRPLSTDEVKVVLLELGYEDFEEYPDRFEQVIHVRKPLGAKSTR